MILPFPSLWLYFDEPLPPLGQLTWLVYMIGSAIGGRVSFNTSDDHDAMDGELVCRWVAFCNTFVEIINKLTPLTESSCSGTE